MASISTGGARDAYLTEVILALRDQLSGEGAKAGATLDRLDKSAGSLDKSFGLAGSASDRFGMSLKSLGLQALALNEIRGLILALLSPLQQVGELSDVWKEMSARVGIFKQPGEQTADIMARIGQIAQQSRTPIAEVGKLYARLAQGLSEQHVSQRDLLNTVQGVSDALLISGASAAEAGGAIMQLSQAMASGTLRGEEFNSIAEQAPVILDALAKHMQVPKGALRDMAAQGLITSQVMRRSIAEMSDQWRAQAQSIPLTIGRAMTNLTSAFTKYIGESKDASDWTTFFAKSLDNLGKNLGTIGPALQDAGTILFYAAMVRGLAVLGQFTQAKMADAKAAKALSIEQQAAAAATVKAAAASEVAAKAQFEEAMSVWEVADAQAAKSVVLANAAIEGRRAAVIAVQIAEANLLEAKSAKEAAIAEVALVQSKKRYYTLIGVGVYEQRLVAAREQLTQATTAANAAETQLAVALGRSRILEVEVALETSRFTMTREALAAANVLVAETEAAVQAAIAGESVARAAQVAAAGKTALVWRELFSVGNLLNASMAAFVGFELGKYLRDAASSGTLTGEMFKGLNHDLQFYFPTIKAAAEAAKSHAEYTKFEADTLKAVNAATGLTITSMKELTAAQKSGLVIGDGWAQQWERGVAVMDQQVQGMGSVDTAYQRTLKSMEKDIAARNTLAKAQSELTSAQIEAAKAAGDEHGALEALAALKQSNVGMQAQDLAQRRALLDVARAQLIVAEEQAKRWGGDNDVSRLHIANLKNQVTEYTAAVAASEALSVAAQTEAQTADVAAKSYGDQSKSLVELQANQAHYEAKLSDIKGAMQLASIATTELGQAEKDAHKAHSDYIVAVGTAATTEIPALQAAMEAADARVNGLNQAIDDGVAANERLVPTQQALAQATRLVADAAKDAAAGVDLQVKALQADTQLAIGRLGLARDQLEQDRAASQFRREDAVLALEIANSQSARQDAINAIRAEDIVQRELSAQAFQNEQDALEAAMHAKEQEADALREKARFLEIEGKVTGDYTREEKAMVDETLRSADALQLEVQRLGVVKITKQQAFDETERLRKKQRELTLTFQEAGVEGIRSIRDVANAIKQADSAGDLEHLAKALSKAWRDGSLAAEEYRALLEDIQKRQNDLADAADKSWKDQKITWDFEAMYKKYGTDIKRAFGMSADPAFTAMEATVTTQYNEWLARQRPGYQKPASEMTAAETFAAQQAPAATAGGGGTEVKVVKFEFPLTKKTVSTKMSDGGANSLLDAIQKEMATALHGG